MVSPLPVSHPALHINLTHLRLPKRFGHLKEDHFNNGESESQPCFPCSLTGTCRKALPYHHIDLGGVVNPRAWRQALSKWLAATPDYCARAPTLSIVSGYTPGNQRCLYSSALRCCSQDCSRGPDGELIRCWHLTYFMHLSCIVGAAHL